MQSQTHDDEAPSLSLRIVPVTPFEQNCSLLICNRTQQAVAIDPGAISIRSIERSSKQEQVLPMCSSPTAISITVDRRENMPTVTKSH